jgi:hypothetical protein
VERIDEEGEGEEERAEDAGHIIQVAGVQREGRGAGLLTILPNERTTKWRMQPARRRQKDQSNLQKRMKPSRILSPPLRRMEPKLNEFLPFVAIGAQPAE